jgi:hypothetical protein
LYLWAAVQLSLRCGGISRRAQPAHCLLVPRRRRQKARLRCSRTAGSLSFRIRGWEDSRLTILMRVISSEAARNWKLIAISCLTSLAMPEKRGCEDRV